MNTPIPCKRPRVRINELLGLDRVAAVCDVPGCGWRYDNVVVTDVRDQATRHRQAHRAAVPDTAILLAHDGHQAECDCGEKWLAPTKAHARTWLRHHLALDHGLVECP